MKERFRILFIIAFALILMLIAISLYLMIGGIQ